MLHNKNFETNGTRAKNKVAGQLKEQVSSRSTAAGQKDLYAR